MTEQKYSDVFADWLVELGYTHCFYVAGGNIMHLLESVSQRLTCIPVVHEAAAAIAAEYFTATAGKGRRAVCLVTAGPGITNAMTGVAGAFTESRELLVIGGQVKSTDLATEGIRQRGIQEIDGMALMAPISKGQIQIQDPVGFDALRSLVNLASSGRPGPVYVEFCLNAQAAPWFSDVHPGPLLADTSSSAALPRPRQETLDRVEKLLGGSTRPVLLIGGGVSRALVQSLRQELSDSALPVATSWNALDRIDWHDPANFGRPDTWGMRWSNLLIQQADLVVAVGARLSLQQTGFNWESFAPLAEVVHIDVDEAELSKPHPRKDVRLRWSAEEFLPWLLAIATDHAARWEDWRHFGRTVKSLLPLDDPENFTSHGYVSPYAFAGWLSDVMTTDDILVPCSSGAAETVMMQAFRQKFGQICINNKALASMGYGLSGAIGVSAAWPNRRVFLTEGDGGFAQNLQELGTLGRLGANVKVFIWDNNGYASIRMTQRRYFGGHYVGCDLETGLGLPAWGALCDAYGIPWELLTSLNPEATANLELRLAEPGPLVTIVSMDPEQTYYPKIDSVVSKEGGMKSAPLHRMTPPLDESLMARVGRYLEEFNEQD